MLHELLLTPTEKKVLESALEFYIRLGLGQVGEIGTRLALLTHRTDVDLKPLQDALTATEEKIKPWKLEDAKTSAHTVAAFGIQCRLGDAYQGAEWAAKRLRELKGEEQI